MYNNEQNGFSNPTPGNAAPAGQVSNPGFTNPSPMPSSAPVAPVSAPSKNNKRNIIIIGAIVALIAIIVAVVLVAMNNSNKTEVSGNSASGSETQSSKTEDFDCPVAGDHIHLFDLTKEDLGEYKIFHSLGMLYLYNDSKIKAIRFNGKDYDYETVVSWLTDLDALSEFLAEEAYSVSVANYDSGKKKTEYKYDFDAELVSQIIRTLSSSRLEGYTSHRFNILAPGEKPVKETNLKHQIVVSVAFDYKKVGYDEYVLAEDMYGIEDGEKEYVEFTANVSGADRSEDFGLVMEDGTYVHLIGKIESMGNAIVPEMNVYVRNRSFNK